MDALIMDSNDDDQMFAAQMDEEEAEAAAEDEEHMQILACLAGLYARSTQPRRGWSARGRRK